MVSRGSSQVAPLIMAWVEEFRKWAGGWAWSDLCLAAVHREMNCTLANTQLNIDKLKQVQEEINNELHMKPHLDKQFKFILLIILASHSLASVRKILTLDWQELRLSLKENMLIR